MVSFNFSKLTCDSNKNNDSDASQESDTQKQKLPLCYKNSPNSQNEVNNAVGLQFLIDAMNGVQLVDFFLELSCDLKPKGWGNKDRKGRMRRGEGEGEGKEG